MSPSINRVIYCWVSNPLRRFGQVRAVLTQMQGYTEGAIHIWQAHTASANRVACTFMRMASDWIELDTIDALHGEKGETQDQFIIRIIQLDQLLQQKLASITGTLVLFARPREIRALTSFYETGTIRSITHPGFPQINNTASNFCWRDAIQTQTVSTISVIQVPILQTPAPISSPQPEQKKRPQHRLSRFDMNWEKKLQREEMEKKERERQEKEIEERERQRQMREERVERKREERKMQEKKREEKERQRQKRESSLRMWEVRHGPLPGRGPSSDQIRSEQRADRFGIVTTRAKLVHRANRFNQSKPIVSESSLERRLDSSLPNPPIRTPKVATQAELDELDAELDQYRANDPRVQRAKLLEVRVKRHRSLTTYWV